MQKVIITGGTGLVGTRLTTLLCQKGYEINILCRNPSKSHEFRWNIHENYIDSKAFDGVSAIIHLAGAGVADQRWTNSRKKEIMDSRVLSTRLLHQYLSTENHTIKRVIAASAVGYYGDRQDEILMEDAAAGSGFLADVCRQWEAATDELSSTSVPTCKLRIGVVLSKEGGALPKLDLPVKFGVGAYMGNGRQYVPWIHIDDLCYMFIHLLEQSSITGAFNGCAPDIKTSKEMASTIASVLHRPFIPVPAPAFLLRTLMGEMAEMVLMSDRCSSSKIEQSGFQFRYPFLKDALENIYGMV